MLGRAIWLVVGVAAVVAAASDRSPIGSAQARGASNGGGDSLSAFIASPIFAHVAPQVPSTIAAGPIFAPRAGLICQTMTQTIDIDGRQVHASALLCRQPDGTWRIAPPQSVNDAPPIRRPAPSRRGSAVATVE